MSDKIKIFISQPMSGKTDEEIVNTREVAEALITAKYWYEDITFIPSFIKKANDINPIFCLGSAIMKLADADIAFFLPGWKESRGCLIEYEVCERYGIEVCELSLK